MGARTGAGMRAGTGAGFGSGDGSGIRGRSRHVSTLIPADATSAKMKLCNVAKDKFFKRGFLSIAPTAYVRAMEGTMNNSSPNISVYCDIVFDCVLLSNRISFANCNYVSFFFVIEVKAKSVFISVL